MFLRRMSRKSLAAGVAAAAALVIVGGAILVRTVLAGDPIDAALLSQDGGRIQSTLLALDPADFTGPEHRQRRSQFVESCKGMPPETLLTIVNSRALTDEQREKLWKTIFDMGIAYTKDVVNDYFAVVNAPGSTPEAQTAFLDAQLDAWVPFMEGMGKYYESNKDGPAIKALEEQRRAFRAKSASRDDRKSFIEAQDPDFTARSMFYFRKLSERAKERGIDMRGGRRNSEQATDGKATDSSGK